MAHIPKLKTLLIPLFLLAISAGCHNYYMVTTKKKDPAVIDSLQTANRDFILRNGSKAYYMKMGAMSEDRKTVQVSLDSLSFIHEVYVKNGPKQNLKYRKPAQEGVL